MFIIRNIVNIKYKNVLLGTKIGAVTMENSLSAPQ